MDSPALCPACMARTVWDLQDRYVVGRFRFSERHNHCRENCGWSGVTALFPSAGNPQMEVDKSILECTDPFKDAVPFETGGQDG